MQDLRLQFAGTARPALDGVSFDLQPGQVTAVVGESGSGKTLTSLAVMGLLPRRAHCSGKLLWAESTGTQTDLLTLSAAQRTSYRGRQMAMVFQEPMTSLNPLRRVGSQLGELLRHEPGTRAQKTGRVLQALAEVQLPDPPALSRAYPHQLSGGQLQRVMLAMAMLLQPRLLIADEPTTALDSLVQHELLELIGQLVARHHTAVLFITHDLHLAQRIAHHLVVMYQGRVVEAGPAARVFGSPAHPYTRALLHCRPSPAAKGFLLPTVAAYMREDGNLPAPLPAPTHIPSDRAVLAVQGLQKTYVSARRRVPALQDVHFEVRQGEIMGVVGASGCGKTTLARILLGQEAADAGTVLLDGQPMHFPTARERALAVQLVFQDPYSSLNPRIRVGDAIAEPMWVHRLHPTRKACREAARVLLQAVDLPAEAYAKYPFQFSGGQRQRIVMARALALQPRILVCDEAVAALDVSVQAQVLNLLLELRARLALTILFISHDLQVIHYLCDRVMVLDTGQVAEISTARDLLQAPLSDMGRRLQAASIS
ncbi:MAG: ABC transporter ATP-binding protein [Bacteroidetes bacterium]|nr:ABC transporter ATP-binding protein [Bacteroidota bacterium]